MKGFSDGHKIHLADRRAEVLFLGKHKCLRSTSWACFDSKACLEKNFESPLLGQFTMLIFSPAPSHD